MSGKNLHSHKSRSNAVGELRKQIADRWRRIREEIDAGWPRRDRKLITRIETSPVDIQPARAPTEFVPAPASCNVTSADGIYYRDGRRTFLFGVEGRLYDGAWINRILGLDLFCQHAGMVWWRAALQLSESPGERGGVKLTARFRDFPWGGVHIREALRAGTLWAPDYYFTKRTMARFDEDYEFDPPFFMGPRDCKRGTGHFLDLHLENPDAFEFYCSQMRYVGRLLQGYPVLHHELINEVRYNSYWIDNIIAFQQAMRSKYGDIQTANRAWGAEHKDFADVFPAVTTDDPLEFYWMGPESRPYALYADWNEFMAAHGANMFCRLRDEVAKALDGSLLTIQSPYSWGNLQTRPDEKVKAEDVYGHEIFFYPYLQPAAGRENWLYVLSLMTLQMEADLARNASPDKPIINLEAPFHSIRELVYDPARFGVTETAPVAGPNAVRMFFWHQLAHGVSGSVLSYFYTNETSDGGESVWDPTVMTRQAIRTIPKVSAEIRDLAEVVIPRPRIRGKMAMLYSYETASQWKGYMGPRDDPASNRKLTRKWRGLEHCEKEMISGYASAVLTRVALDIITERNILASKASDYPVVFLNKAIRLGRQTMEKLKQYVAAGGTLIVGPGSMQCDETFAPLEAEPLLGAHRELLRRQPPPADLASISPAPCAPTETRLMDKAFGHRLDLTDAQGIGTSSAGPPISVRRLGEGRVYTIGWNFAESTLRDILRWICRQAGVEPAVDVAFDDGIDADFVEAHLFGDPEGDRFVVYALNFGGGPRKARLIPKDLPSRAGGYLVRSVATGRYIRAGDTEARELWRDDDLAAGIPARLEAQDPELFLLEHPRAGSLELRGLTQEQKQVLAWAWRDSPPSEHRVLIDGYHVAEFRVSKPKMPTAVKAMEDAGWEVNSCLSRLGRKVRTFSHKGIGQEKLNSYQVLVFSGLRHKNAWEKDELRRLKRFVHDGGGLLICLKRDWHSNRMSYADAMLFGVDDAGGNVYDPARSIMGEPLYVGFKPCLDHPITRGVSVFQTTGIRPLAVGNAGAQVLFAASEDAEIMDLWGNRTPADNAPVMIAAEAGEGRVVAVGSDTWTRPEEMEFADNRTLLINILNWLARRDSK